MKTTHLRGFLFALPFILTNCQEQQANFRDAADKATTSLKIKNLQLDTVTLTKVNTSFIGEIHINRGNIYFVDNKFCYVYSFNPTGKLTNRFIGQGEGENELPIKNITMSTFLPGGNMIFIGNTWDCFIFDSQFKKINEYDINWHSNVTKEQMLNNPDPGKTYMYSLIYSGNMRATDKKLFFPIVSQHPAFNPTVASYGINARILGQMDIETGYVDKIFGRLSPRYHNSFNSLVFAYPIFDLQGDERFLVSFPADSNIYTTDVDFNVREKFGAAGKAMDTSYTNTTKPTRFHQNYKDQTYKKGFYTYIKYIKEKNITFRGYHKGAEATDGLQIYKHNVLIADIDVPKHFEVKGYIAPYYYSGASIDEYQSTIKLFRFKINEF